MFRVEVKYKDGNLMSYEPFHSVHTDGVSYVLRGTYGQQYIEIDLVESIEIRVTE